MATEKRLICLDEALEATHKEVFWTESEQAAVRSFLVKQPKVDAVEVVHGRWVATPAYKFNRLGKLIYYCDNHHCSECKTEIPIVPPYNYCPNCGAKMDGDGNGT